MLVSPEEDRVIRPAEERSMTEALMEAGRMPVPRSIEPVADRLPKVERLPRYDPLANIVLPFESI